ncbi:MAG: hypothetical protein STHCBS139747_001053 [Sporothrix thermara]
MAAKYNDLKAADYNDYPMPEKLTDKEVELHTISMPTWLHATVYPDRPIIASIDLHESCLSTVLFLYIKVFIVLADGSTVYLGQDKNHYTEHDPVPSVVVWRSFLFNIHPIMPFPTAGEYTIRYEVHIEDSLLGNYVCTSKDISYTVRPSSNQPFL